ncbi:hypothetical protein ACHAWO_001627 [Cyclotella atomus]|uniref:Uncharacterized protein n=1 Tax=Cyclotella atomus TaxID=382360 RepID=A0ABD3PB46_9STRA
MAVAFRPTISRICEGAVGNQVNDNGCGISPNDLKDLQAKCERQVNRMTGGDSSIVHDDHFKDDDKWHGSGGDDGYEYIVNTETPTAHPTKKKWGGGWSDDWHGSGDDNFNINRLYIIATRYSCTLPLMLALSELKCQLINQPGNPLAVRQPARPRNLTGVVAGQMIGLDLMMLLELSVLQCPQTSQLHHPPRNPHVAGIIRTSMPTDEPTPSPSKKPTSRPTNRPTHRPTNRLVQSYSLNLIFKIHCAHRSTYAMYSPTARPTNRPTNRWTNRSMFNHSPTARPTNRPSARPTNRPTDRPTKRPSRNPTSRPTKKPHGWGGWNDDGYGYIETAIPTSSPTFAETEASSSEFRDGFKRGEERAEAIWRDNGSDCGYIFSFQDDVDKDLEKNCSNDSSFCQGARAGSYKVVKFYEKQCLEDTADECNDLGIAAAQELAFEYCPFDASSSFAPESQPDYKEACREVATGICKGAVGDQVMDNGCTISTSELKDLQDKCERQVDEMTGGSSSIIDDDHTDDHTDDGKWHGSGDDEFAGIVRTELPTSTPTYYPTKWGGWKGPITEPEPYSHGWGWKHKRGGKPTSHDNDWDN